MDKIVVWNRMEGDIHLLKMDFYTYIQQHMDEEQILAYHIDRETLKNIEANLQTSRIFSLLQKEDNYMITNDLEENILKICNYENPDEYNHYQVQNGNLSLVGGKSFIHDAISFKYMRGLNIYTTQTYQDVLAHFMNQKQMVEEIEKEIQKWPLEKQKVFRDHFVLREEVKTYVKKEKNRKNKKV